MRPTKPDETRHGVSLTNHDQPLFDGAGTTKRDLVDYLDAASDRILPGLKDRPLSVTRVHRGQEAVMQKNVQIGRTNVRTPVTNAQIVCLLLLETKNK